MILLDRLLEWSVVLGFCFLRVLYMVALAVMVLSSVLLTVVGATVFIAATVRMDKEYFAQQSYYALMKECVLLSCAQRTFVSFEMA
ncbi:hypothetical protein FF1_045461 [Malus domestica]